MNDFKTRSKIFALLTAYAYPKRRYQELKKDSSVRGKYWYKGTRGVDLKSKILKDFDILPEYTNSQVCTFFNKKTNEIIFSIRGTDLTRLEENDLYVDIQLFCGKEKFTNRYNACYEKLEQIINLYPNSKISLCGASLGGRLAIGLLDSDLGKKLYEIHVFNCATSFCHLYVATECLKDKNRKKQYCLNREKLHIHMVNKDPISILSMGEISKSKTIYDRKETSSSLFKGKNKKIKTNHSIMNFV